MSDHKNIQKKSENADIKKLMNTIDL